MSRRLISANAFFDPRLSASKMDLLRQLVLTIAEQTDTTSASVLAAANEVGQTAGTLDAEVSGFFNAMKQGDGDHETSRLRA
ncbi:MAG TPA: hypothetical protein VGM32_06015 [Rhodopila sp.]